LNKNNNLTHEDIKLKTLKEKLLKNSSKNDFIVEIKLDLESLTKLLLCRGIFDEASIQIEYTSIHSDAFQGMNCLQKIDLTNNAITHLDNRIFHEGLVHLEELKLGYNAFEKFKTIVFTKQSISLTTCGSIEEHEQTQRGLFVFESNSHY